MSDFAGTSIGSVICLFLCCGYKPIDIFNVCLDTDFKKLSKLSLVSLFSQLGLDSGDRAEDWIGTFLDNKAISREITMLELFNVTGKNLIVTSTNIMTKKAEYLSYKTHP